MWAGGLVARVSTNKHEIRRLLMLCQKRWSYLAQQHPPTCSTKASMVCRCIEGAIMGWHAAAEHRWGAEGVRQSSTYGFGLMGGAAQLQRDDWLPNEALTSSSSISWSAGVDIGLSRWPSKTNRSWAGSTDFRAQKDSIIFWNLVVRFTLKATCRPRWGTRGNPISALRWALVCQPIIPKQRSRWAGALDPTHLTSPPC
jgi:hypothetical protein